MNDKYSKIYELIKKSNNILVTCHTRPDGDSCGCVTALCLTLKGMNKNVTPFLLTPFADWLMFLFEGLEPVICGENASVDELMSGRWADTDLVIIVDTNSRIQLPGFEKWLDTIECPVVVFDHHITGDGLGDVEAINTEAASAGQVICDFFNTCGIDITPQVARSLFTSMASDTGWFRFGNRARGDVYRMAAKLIDIGVDPDDIYNRLYQQSSYARAKLTAKMLESMEMYFDGRVACQSILQSDFEQTGAKGRDTEGLIQEPQKIAAVQVTVLFIEQADGKLKCSMRSKGSVNVREIAQKFGGGGHDLAAGATFDLSLADTKKIILEEIGMKL